MAVRISSQYTYSGRGPLDSKSLVKTYAELLSEATWQVEAGKISAYNGMIVAVWLNKDDTSKNGIYFLHDATVTSTFKAPDVTNSANWHKLGGIDALPDLAAQVADIQKDLESIQDDVDDLRESATVVVDTKDALLKPGIAGKIYVVTEEAMTYVWYNDDYLPVGDGRAEPAEEIQIIHGGSASA